MGQRPVSLWYRDVGEVPGGSPPVSGTWRTPHPPGRALALSEGARRIPGFEERASR